MIYLVEDDTSIRELVVYTLNMTGFEAVGFENPSEFDEAMNESVPDLVILDIMLPGEDGISILRRLRDTPDTADIPIIMLTAKDSEFDKVTGLNSGADDYIAKPFGMMELLARINAVMRRYGITQSEKEQIEINGLYVNFKTHDVKVHGVDIKLTLKEYDLLCYLIKNLNIVLTRDRILNHVWGYDFDGETRTVDVHIGSLRQKLHDCGNMIETVKGYGYKIGGGS